MSFDSTFTEYGNVIIDLQLNISLLTPILANIEAEIQNLSNLSASNPSYGTMIAPILEEKEKLKSEYALQLADWEDVIGKCGNILMLSTQEKDTLFDIFQTSGLNVESFAAQQLHHAGNIIAHAHPIVMDGNLSASDKTMLVNCVLQNYYEGTFPSYYPAQDYNPVYFS